MSISGFVIGAGPSNIPNQDHGRAMKISVDVDGVEYKVYAVPTMPEPKYNTPIVFNQKRGFLGSKHYCSWGGNDYDQVEYSEIYDPTKIY